MLTNGPLVKGMMMSNIYDLLRKYNIQEITINDPRISSREIKYYFFEIKEFIVL